MNNSLVTLWRPVGPAELELIRASGMLRFRRGFPSSQQAIKPPLPHGGVAICLRNIKHGWGPI